MDIQTIEVAGLIPAMMALRLPHSLPERSVKYWQWEDDWSETPIHSNDMETLLPFQNSYHGFLSAEDLKLAARLVKGGDEHAKVLRGVVAYVKIRACRAFFQEFATYKIGCECLSSESTMHTITKRALTESDFEGDVSDAKKNADNMNALIEIYKLCDYKRKGAAFLRIKRNLPESFLQTRMYMISYQTLRRMHQQRKSHRLPEWRVFCAWIESLPFAEELITGDYGKQAQ